MLPMTIIRQPSLYSVQQLYDIQPPKNMIQLFLRLI